MFRHYELKRLDTGNVIRSPKGAFARADEFGVGVMIQTIDALLPGNLETLYRNDTCCLFDGITDGTVIDGRLYSLVYNKLTGSFDTEIGIKLSAISGTIFVSYSTRGKKNGPELLQQSEPQLQTSEKGLACQPR